MPLINVPYLWNHFCWISALLCCLERVVQGALANKPCGNHSTPHKSSRRISALVFSPRAWRSAPREPSTYSWLRDVRVQKISIFQPSSSVGSCSAGRRVGHADERCALSGTLLTDVHAFAPARLMSRCNHRADCCAQAGVYGDDALIDLESDAAADAYQLWRNAWAAVLSKDDDSDEVRTYREETRLFWLQAMERYYASRSATDSPFLVRGDKPGAPPRSALACSWR